MRSLVLGTAGHIDHGKSELVTALTGTDPDRLAQEKERGITIELGFAQLTLPSGRHMSVVDVPGHERFVRQMVAGATGIDLVLLVVAADDGIMPQTREHLAIINLLGIPRGVVAITKSDLADQEWLDLVVEDVRGLIAPTSISGAPIVPVSARTGAGLPELLSALDVVAAESEGLVPTHGCDKLCLPVDRVFTITGAGTVVTGTLWSGTAAHDDPIEVYPSGLRGRIRSVQMHGSRVERAESGNRVALNIAGLGKDDIARGDIVAAPGSLVINDRFDAWFTYLPGESRPFESGTRVHVHHGTREVLGRVLLMGDADVHNRDAGRQAGQSNGQPDQLGTRRAHAAELQPGQSAFVQVRLEEPLTPRSNDRFIVRSYSPVWTIGGGVILDVSPPRRTTLKTHERELLEALLHGDVAAAALGLVTARGLPMTSAGISKTICRPRSQVADALNQAGLERLSAESTTHFMTAETSAALMRGIEQELLAFHDAHPRATGIGIPALRDRVDRRLTAKVFDALIERAAASGIVEIAGGEVRHPAAASCVLAAEEEAARKLTRLLVEQGLTPASIGELATGADVDVPVARKVLSKLAAEGHVVRLGGDLHFDATAVARAREMIVAYLREHGTILARDARDLTGTTRKYVVPLLEHFDAQGITKRDGDVRILGRQK